jgi:hypothetical protein
MLRHVLWGFWLCLQENFDIIELLPVLLLGVIGGLLGSCFTYLNEGLADWRKRGARSSVCKANTVDLHCMGAKQKPGSWQQLGGVVSAPAWAAPI